MLGGKVNGVSSALADFIVNKKPNNTDANAQMIFPSIYMVFLAAFSVACRSFGDLGMSSCITLALALQFFAYCSLALKAVCGRSVRGVSAASLRCHAVVHIARLVSTSYLQGYTPADSTGDWLYQAMDGMCLVAVVGLLFLVHGRYRSTYQAECDDDGFDTSYMLTVCLLMAVILHPDLNTHPVFDTLWTFALYVDVVAMLPQLRMLAKLDIGADGRTAADQIGDVFNNVHFVVAMVASRGLSLYFALHSFRELAPPKGGVNLAGWVILVAHVIQVLLLGDFVVFYIKACVLGSMGQVLWGRCARSRVRLSTVYEF